MQSIIHKMQRKFSKSISPTLMVILTCIVILTISGYRMLPLHSQPLRSLEGQRVTPSHSASSNVTIAQQVDLGQLFQELGIDGSIVIYDKNNDRFYEHNPSRNTTAFFPASTFKIFNALVSLETGVIQDDVAVLTWDGIKREIPAWNRDTNLRQAFKDSTFWFYQVLARKIGHQLLTTIYIANILIIQVRYFTHHIPSRVFGQGFWIGGNFPISPVSFFAKNNFSYIAIFSLFSH